MNFFADTSALLKRYVREVGSKWIDFLLSSPEEHQFFIALITMAEIDSALARRTREGTISPEECKKLQDDFLIHTANEYSFVELNQASFLVTRRLLNTHPLRAADAIQLASALKTNAKLVEADSSPVIFLSADDRLLNAAAREGLQVDNPNSHP